MGRTLQGLTLIALLYTGVACSHPGTLPPLPHFSLDPPAFLQIVSSGRLQGGYRARLWVATGLGSTLAWQRSGDCLGLAERLPLQVVARWPLVLKGRLLQVILQCRALSGPSQ